MTDLERAYALVHSDPERIEAALAAARRDGAEEAIRGFKERLNLRFNNHLVEMKEGYDDSIVGFNEAWDIARKLLDEAVLALPLTPEEPA